MYPPRNLWAGPSSDPESTNYWREYVTAVLCSLPEVKYYETWNEPNNRRQYFGNPDPLHYGTGSNPIDTPRERCSLYVRMCWLAKQVAERLDHGQRIVAGVVGSLLWHDETLDVSPGIEWQNDMLDIAELRYGGAENCFDIVSIHDYEGDGTRHITGSRKYWTVGYAAAYLTCLSMK
jgi:hypothetical protein